MQKRLAGASIYRMLYGMKKYTLFNDFYDLKNSRPPAGFRLPKLGNVTAKAQVLREHRRKFVQSVGWKDRRDPYPKIISRILDQTPRAST